MNSFKSLIAASLLATLPLSVLAEESAESFKEWDQIVTELRGDIQRSAPKTDNNYYGIDDVKISFGVGLSFSYLSLGGDPVFTSSGLLRGIGFQFGIDLFHPEFQAEGAFRNYSSYQLSDEINAQVREFELRLVHSRRLPHSTSFRLGAGLSARQVDVAWRSSEGSASRSDSSPSAVFLLGVGRTFGKALFIGPDLSFRSPFAGSSLEQSSMDFHLRANAVF